MKKIIYIPVCLFLAFCLVSCSNQKNISCSQNKNGFSFKKEIKGSKKSKTGAQYTTRHTIKYNPRFVNVKSESSLSQDGFEYRTGARIQEPKLEQSQKKNLGSIAAQNQSYSSIIELMENDDSNIEEFEAKRQDAERLNNFNKRFKGGSWFYKKQSQLPNTIPEGEKVKQAQGLAIASLVLGIVGMFILPVPLGILAVIFASIAFARINKHPGLKGIGFAIAGMVIGLVALILGLLLIASMN